MGKIANSRLERRKPLERSKKPFYARSKKPKNRRLLAPNGKFWERKNKKSFKKISKKREGQQEQYRQLHKPFLAKPENRWCVLCICRSMTITWTEAKELLALYPAEGDMILRLALAKLTPATELHHFAGRIGKLLTYEPYLIASCLECRDFPHANPATARELGVLAPAPQWNVFPKG